MRNNLKKKEYDFYIKLKIVNACAVLWKYHYMYHSTIYDAP